MPILRNWTSLQTQKHEEAREYLRGIVATIPARGTTRDALNRYQQATSILDWMESRYTNASYADRLSTLRQSLASTERNMWDMDCDENYRATARVYYEILSNVVRLLLEGNIQTGEPETEEVATTTSSTDTVTVTLPASDVGRTVYTYDSWQYIPATNGFLREMPDDPFGEPSEVSSSACNCEICREARGEIT